MGLINPSIPVVGQPDSTEEPKVATALSTIVSEFNGGIDSANLEDGAVTGVKLASAVEAATGVNGASTRRGKCIIATEESRTNTAFGTLTTPDQVSSIVLPTDGLLLISYSALWKSSVSGAADASLFIGATRLARREDSTSMGVTTTTTANANRYEGLVSGPIGLRSVGSAPSDQPVDVTTGQTVGFYNSVGVEPYGGLTVVFAAAGTYTVSVQFKSTSGSVTVKGRKLWVWSMGFD